MVCHQHDLQKSIAHDDVNEKTILIRFEEYHNNFEEDGILYKVCKGIEVCEAYGMVSQ